MNDDTCNDCDRPATTCEMSAGVTCPAQTGRGSMPDCPHPSPVGFVGWSAPMATIGGRERQAAEWCRRCGALGVWSEDGDRVEWFRPGTLAEMPDCSAQDAPRTPFRDPGAGVVAEAEVEALCGEGEA